MFDDTSHQIELTLLLIMGFFACITEDYYVHWIVGAAMALCCLIVDMMFFGENTFIYDPDYNHWKDLSEPKEFQFKTD